MTVHSDTVLKQSRQLGGTLADANRHLSDYLTHHDRRALAAYKRAAVLGPRQSAKLRDLVRDNPDQYARAKRLTELSAQFFNTLNMLNEEYRTGRRAQANALAQAPSTRQMVLQLQSTMTLFDQTEESLRDARRSSQKQREALLTTIIFAGSVLGILLTVATAMYFGVRIARRLEHLARNAQRFEFDGTFTTPVPGNDEIAHLDSIYQRMAQRIKEREAQLQRYKILAEQASDIIFFIRRDTGAIVEANEAALKAYGYSREEMYALTVRELRAPGYRANIEAEIQKAAESGMLMETMHRRRDGTTFPVEFASQGIVVNGELLLVSIVRDITERRRTESEIASSLAQAMEASRLKSQFVATMSHEIRTPMNGVIGMTELLLRSPLSDEQREYAGIIRDSGQSLLRIIDDILDFSKIEADALALEIVEVQMLPLVEGVARLLTQQAAAKQITLMSFVDPKIPAHVFGDPGRLRQVLINLAGNAMKFTHHGGIAITAEAVSRGERSVRVRFSVKDTGIGISAQAIPSLFEPFRQADGSTTRKYGGTGLGLSISKRLVELMGGNIAVQSTPSAGSTFSFELDFKIAPGEESFDGLATRDMRVLVVDDDPISREILGRYVKSWDMQLDTAVDAAAAYLKLQEAADSGTPYNVAIFDLVMREMDGLALARHVVQFLPDSVGRMILVTAHDQPGQGNEAIEAGFSAYLVKPVRQSQLFDCIASATPPVMQAPSNAPGAAPGAAAGAGTVLVVEDNVVNRTLAQRQLEKLGYKCELVTNGRDAFDAVATRTFSAVLMDCHMPEMDGFQATRIIRKMEARTGGHVPIIAMTANALAEDRDECLAAGMDDYLSKPVTLETLRVALEKNARANGTHQVLDFARLSDLFDGDRDEIKNFLDMAVRSLGDLVERLGNASDAERPALAHELKGAAGNAGATHLADAAADIERGNGSVSAVAAAYRQVLIALQAFSQQSETRA